MSEQVVKLLEQIMELSPEDRRAIAEHLWDAVECDEASAELWDDPVFRAEIERRMDEAEKHPERLIDADEAFRMIRERLAEERARNGS
jgi:putative addiction module component (TIGR02574 family)